MSQSVRTFLRGTVEFLDVTVAADTELSGQPVALSFDAAVWHVAAWVGDAGKNRTARLLMNAANFPAASASPVYIKITDNPEAPILRAGSIYIQTP